VTRQPSARVRSAAAAFFLVRAVAIIAVAAPVLTSCGRPVLPPRLAALPRTEWARGAKAAQGLAALHGRQVAPATSAFAEYGRGRLRLWLSIYPDDAQARRAVEAMLSGISTGGTPFSPPRQERAWGSRWFIFGPGGHNLVWSNKDTVYWLQGEPDLLGRAIDELPAPPAGLAI